MFQRWWKPGCAGAVLAVTLTASHAAYSQAGPGALLRVTTYNIHHASGNDDCTPPAAAVPPAAECGLDLERVIATIRSFDADVVALQEVDRFWARSGAADQPALLEKALGLSACYGANLDHPADSHSAVPHQYGTLILSRHPLAQCRNTHLPRPDDTEQRGLLEAVVTLAGTQVRIFNTHLHTSNPARTMQARAVAAAAGAASGPVLLMGDFNATPGAPELLPIHERLEDVWKAGGTGPEFTSPAALTGDPRRRIDYVFAARGHVEIVSATVIVTAQTRVASDHFPVSATVRVR